MAARATRRGGAPYVEYAWGDRRFYRDLDYGLWSLYAAAALPTASVVYLAAARLAAAGGVRGAPGPRVERRRPWYRASPARWGYVAPDGRRLRLPLHPSAV